MWETADLSTALRSGRDDKLDVVNDSARPSRNDRKKSRRPEHSASGASGGMGQPAFQARSLRCPELDAIADAVLRPLQVICGSWNLMYCEEIGYIVAPLYAAKAAGGLDQRAALQRSDLSLDLRPMALDKPPCPIVRKTIA
jgi:hypothetical protein